jgi:epoxyqueuosine reductase
MLDKNEIIKKAYECGFGDIGFTTADPFETQKELLQERYQEYEWAFKAGLDLMAGTDPKQILPQAKTIIVLLEVYFSQAFPASMERHFGRCYLLRKTGSTPRCLFICLTGWPRPGPAWVPSERIVFFIPTKQSAGVPGCCP